MPLSHPLLTQSPRLVAASNNSPSLKAGEKGDGVVRLQLACLSLGSSLPRSTGDQTAMPDGIFGSETTSAVKAFQRARGLTVDGVAGTLTLTAMNTFLTLAKSKKACCANGGTSNGQRATTIKQSLQGANFRALAAGSAPATSITPPTGMRFLTAGQKATATATFGSSLDFTRILLSDATGLGGAAFTVAVEPVPGARFVVINTGTFSPPPNLLIHELAHAWQSQHSIIPTRFMINSVESQGIAGSLRLLGADASAYYFKPGKSFSLYGAEQIACQVEKGVTSIVTSIKSLPPFIPHPANEISLSVPRWEVAGPGVDTSC